MPAFPTRVHAGLDLALAAALLTAPFWGGFAGPNPETWVAVLAGIGLAIYTLISDHELGLWKRVQMPVHLWIDALTGIVVAASPWVFSFDSRVWAPHLVLGLILLAMAAISHTIPGYDRRGAARTRVD